MNKPNRADFEKWFTVYARAYLDVWNFLPEDSRKAKSIAFEAYIAGVHDAERQPSVCEMSRGDQNTVIMAIVYLKVLQSNAYVKGETVLAYHVEEVIASLDKLINPE